MVVGILGGCGGGKDYANDPRPPTPINVSVAITSDQVTVSPHRFGAGPVVLLIANETDKAYRITIQSDELGASKAGIRQQTAPINPQGTATLKVLVRDGRYTVGVGRRGIQDAQLHVKGHRPSAQDKVLQP